MVPQGFQEEVQQAKQENQPAKLILLGLEAKGAPWQDEGLRLVEHPSKPSAFECVILFTGHRVDSASRKTPRFPASMEPVARKAIRDALLQQQETAKGPMLGIAGGASGGDILFLEICQELGIRTEMLLALPADQFIKASVESDDKSWVTRFQQQLAKHPNPPVLAQSPELPELVAVQRALRYLAAKQSVALESSPEQRGSSPYPDCALGRPNGRWPRRNRTYGELGQRTEFAIHLAQDQGAIWIIGVAVTTSAAFPIELSSKQVTQGK